MQSSNPVLTRLGEAFIPSILGIGNDADRKDEKPGPAQIHGAPVQSYGWKNEQRHHGEGAQQPRARATSIGSCSFQVVLASRRHWRQPRAG